MCIDHGTVTGTPAKAPTNPDPKPAPADAHHAKRVALSEPAGTLVTPQTTSPTPAPARPPTFFLSPGQRSAEQTPTVNAALAPAANPFEFANTASPRQPARVAPAPADDSARQQLVAETLANLAKLGYTGIGEDDLGKLNPPDIYEEELQVMAEVRAYFQVAYKVCLPVLHCAGRSCPREQRVIDYIPLSIDHHFLYAFVKQLQQLLFERLGLGTARSAERCNEYVAEEPTIVATRDELLTKKKRLENVQRALFNFGM